MKDIPNMLGISLYVFEHICKRKDVGFDFILILYVQIHEESPHRIDLIYFLAHHALFFHYNFTKLSIKNKYQN